MIEAGQTFSSQGQGQSFTGRLWNVSDGTMAGVSLAARLAMTGSESATVTSSIPPSLVSLTDTKTFEIQYIAQNTWSSPAALGFWGESPANVDRFVYVYIRKLN